MIMVQLEGIRDIHHSIFNKMLNKDGMVLVRRPKEGEKEVLVMGIIET